MPADMKNIIGEAFVKMVARKGIDKITVKSLIEECHISRQTFYYHFQDIMDVLEWCVRQETNTLVKESLKAEDLQTALQIFISFNTNFPSNVFIIFLLSFCQYFSPINIFSILIYAPFAPAWSLNKINRGRLRPSE